MAQDFNADGGSAETVRDGGSIVTVGAGGAGPVVVPDNVFLLTAGFDRAGADLRLVGKDGQAVLVKDYFAGGGTPADLATTTGAIVHGQTAKILAGSPALMQVAQAGGVAAGPAAIGKVTAVTGDVMVQRAGVLLSSTGPEKVGIDTPIYRNDVLQTGKGATVAVTFVDKTNFSLGEDARMVMNEFAYNPQTGAGNALLSVLQGSFSFVSGQVAKSGEDAIKVQMPTMTIGIRGTKVAGYAAAEGSESQVTLLQNDDGTVGKIFVFNSSAGYLITQANFTAYSTGQAQAFQQPTLLVNLTKYQDTLSTLQKAIHSQGDRAALDKQSPTDIALARALNEAQPGAGGENQGGGSGGFTTQNFGDLGITLVTFRSGGDLFAAVFNNTDPTKAGGDIGTTNTATNGVVNQELPPPPPSQVVASNVSTPEDDTASGAIPPPDGANPGALTFTLIVPPILGSVTLAADGTFVYMPGNVLQALAQGQTASDSFTVQIAGGPNGTVNQVIGVNIIGENDAPVAGPSQGAVVEDQAGATQGNVLATAADIDNGAILQVVSVNGIVLGGPGGGSGAGGTLQLTQTVLNYLSSQGQALVNGLGGAAGFGENTVPVGDDNSFPQEAPGIDISSVFTGGLNFFGTTYNALFVNNNGNITFTGPLNTFTPSQIGAGFNAPIIAPFWADVDTRGTDNVPPTPGGNSTGSDNVYYDLDAANHVFTVTWDDVGYFSGATDKVNAFQLQLIDRGDGNFDIVFRYESINWTTGNASGGSGGLGGSPARGGYTAGDGTHYFELPGSGNQGSVLAWDESTGNTGQVGVYVFQVRGGQVVGGSGSATIETDYGTLVMNADGSYTYTPDNASPLVQALAQGETYNDSFTYTVADEFGATSQTTLTITITGTNDAPVAQPDINLVAEDGGSVGGNVLGNDTDVDHGAVRQVVSVVASAPPDGQSAALVTPDASVGSQIHGQYGTLVLNADGSYTYTVDPDSAALQALGQGQHADDFFTYTVSDGQGGSATATLTISVTGSNDPPTAMSDAIQAVEDGGPVATSFAALLANDTDPEGNITVASVSATSAAGAAVSIVDGQVIYDPGQLFQSLGQGESTTDSFTYTVTDSAGAQSSSTVTVTVAGVNDAPTANADAIQAIEDGGPVATSFAALLANDTDPEGNITVASVSSTSAAGAAVSIVDGQVVYDPGELFQSLGQGESTTDSFTYTITDNFGAQSSSTVTVAVAGANDAPIAEADRYAAVSDDSGPVALHIAAPTDSDAHDVLSATISGLPTNGEIHLANGAAVTNGQVLTVGQLTGLTFTPTDTHADTHSSFSYVVTDGHGGSDSATIAIDTIDANHQTVVGYYDLIEGQGNPGQVASIQAAGYAAVNVTEPTAAQLAGIDVFFVQGRPDVDTGSEYLSHLGDIAAAVANGMTLIFHDNVVTGANEILPGGESFTIVQSFADGDDVNVLAPDSLLANGPGGVITNATLDNASYSTHGFALSGTLPADAELLLSNGTPSDIVAFSYAYGAGHVYYATIPLEYYLGGSGDPDLTPVFEEIYAPNVVAYGASLGGLAEGHQFAGTTGADLLAGGGGGDVLVGGGGHDLILGGAGDDRLVVKDLGFLKADGGTGNDVLAFDTNGTIDLSALDAGHFAGIERLDIGNGRADTLQIGADQVLALNSEHQGADNTAANALKVLGDAGDGVKLVGDWQAGAQDSGGQGFQLYTLGDAKIAVEQQDISVQIIH
ncbi:MAG: VCBS domain-containing protein [Alphaproteobacteria bacterium]|nr:VCBS domain-containing protein [Alphaproteobacteria bacterium]